MRKKEKGSNGVTENILKAKITPTTIECVEIQAYVWLIDRLLSP